VLTRKPAVAGSFYPSDPEELKDALKASYIHPLGPGRLPPPDYATKTLVACVAPHAGYSYSAPVAAHAYLHVASLKSPDLVVVVAPNHYGVGSGVATFPDGSWETPLGKVRVDTDAAGALAKSTGILDVDPEAHKMEHSLEVQLPFLQELYGDTFSLLPVSLAFQDEETASTLGKGIAEIAKGKETVLVASSDLTHYEPAASAKRKDLALVDTITSMDVRGFYRTLESLQVTACGFGPIATVMVAARALGARRGKLLKYATSGDTTNDFNSVVGYAAIRFE
jgi:AmmeMemoRadiSam system protein B